MSIIIRLQNLPLSAKSGDVRSFFGGLHIPNGGVHILGGERGDAFIAFTSNEDARLAMKKDGEKIKDSRIRLFLSSHSEMKYEVEKITKCSFVDTSSHKLFSSPDRIPEEEVTRYKLPEKSDRKRFSRSRSPHKFNDWDNDKFRNHYHQRSKSPGKNTYDSSEVLPSRYRSSSRKRSRSSSPHQSQSPRLKSVFERERSVSPKMPSYSHQSKDDIAHSDWIKPEYYNNSGIDPSRHSEILAQLEKRITEALEMNPAFNARSISENQESAVAAPDVSNIEQMYFSQGFGAPFPVRNTPDILMQNDFHFSTLSPSLQNNALQFQDSEFQQSIDRNHQNIPPSTSHREIFESRELGQPRMNFFITMSGMNPTWDLRKVQIMMKGIYAPLNCIKWERDDSGYKTGTAFVKLSNKEDFECMISKATFMFDGRRITVSECPSFLISKYFPEDSSFQNTHNVPQKGDFCYVLKGLPFSCTYDDIVSFFCGFDIADIVIIYGKHGRASGTGFISFTNWKDFEGAKAQNGKKIGHRYIEMLPCSEKEMVKAKNHNESTIPPFINPERKLRSSSRRPLCALLTGLPFFTNAKKLSSFFSESGLKPDAIHITLNTKRQCDGRAFVEFVNFQDFDLALKLHGTKFRDNIICVKQVLFDEMTKILEAQKAKHHFEVQTPSTSLSDVPEKVPYLWEPPDSAEEQEKFDDDSTNIELNSHSFEPSFNYKSSISNYGNSRSDQAFDPFRTAEGKLSPVKDLFALNNFQDKNVNASAIKMKDEDFKREFPEERGRHPYRERSFERERRYSRDEKHTARNSKDEYFAVSEVYVSKSRNEKDSRRSNNGKFESHDRSPVWSDPVYPEKDEKSHDDKSKECIVQLSNVNQNVGTHDIMDFLHGFTFFKDSVIRRYTSEGEPTGDVRVTFPNRREAERAVRSLNRCRLQDMRVSMFIA